jgi:hypothetical protein
VAETAGRDLVPPRALRPAQLGVVLVGRVTIRPIGATVVDLAERGYLRVELIEDDARDWQITDLDAGSDGLPRNTARPNGLLTRCSTRSLATEYGAAAI